MKAFSRVNDLQLHGMAQEFVPIPISPVSGMDGYNEALEYLVSILEYTRDNETVLNIDQDCFIFDWSAVEDIVQHVKDNNINYVGVLDNARIPGRNNASPVVMNPFFNVFRFYRNPVNIPMDRLLQYHWHIEYALLPNYPKLGINDCEPTQGEFEEPYNCLFNFLFVSGYKPLYLESMPSLDGISTYLLWKGKPFCVHTWYSREYGHDADHTARINAMYTHAKSLVKCWAYL